MSVPRALLSCACGVAAGVFGGAAEGVAAPVAAQTAVAAPANAHVAPDSFFIQAFDVAGVTKLSADEVERLVYPFAGPGRGKDDVEHARKALQDAYAAKGFSAVIVDVPVQGEDSFRQGIIQIAVSEVPVGQIRVTGSRWHSLWVARDQVGSLAESAPIDFNKLQSDITVANRFPDRTINPQFKPGDVPGTLDVDLKVDDQRPIHASVQLDNDASPSTTPTRLTASARYTNLWQAGHSASVTFVTAPENPKDTEVFAGSYTIPFLTSDWSLSLSGYYSNSNVGSLGGSSVLGNGFQVGLRAIWHLPAEHTVQTLSFGPDFKDFKQKITVGSVLASSAPIRYVPFELQYALSGATEHSSYALSLGATVGLRMMHGTVCIANASGPCTVADAFQNREISSYENFVRGNLSLDYSYAFGNDTIAAFRMTGQLADSHLITNEQFSAGGLSSVRGYYSAEAVGDNGIAPSIELRSPSLAGHFGRWMTDARFFAFTDTAFIHVLDPQSGQNAGFALVGVGGGLKLRLFKRFSGDILAGVPLTNGSTTKRFEPRISFDVKGEF